VNSSAFSAVLTREKEKQKEKLLEKLEKLVLRVLQAKPQAKRVRRFLHHHMQSS
jgi:hypothetical protein